MNKAINILYRYFLLIIIYLIIFSTFFSTILIYIFNQISLVYLNFITPTVLIENSLVLLKEEYMYEIIRACLALSSYLLIAIICFTLPLKIKKSLKLFFSMILTFTFFNLVRILFLMTINTIYGKVFFEKYHLIFYEGLTGIFTALIIIFFLYKNKIKKIYPIYSDIFFLIKKIKKSTKK